MSFLLLTSNGELVISSPRKSMTFDNSQQTEEQNPFLFVEILEIWAGGPTRKHCGKKMLDPVGMRPESLHFTAI